MEEFINFTEKMNKVLEENKDMYETVCMEDSPVLAFNIIKSYAIELGYKVYLFKRKQTSTRGFFGSDNIKVGYVYLIHIRNYETGFFYSIYYDDNDYCGCMFSPYYETYDGADTERYFDNEEDINEMINNVKGILKHASRNR